MAYVALGTVGTGSVLTSAGYNQLIANNVTGHPTLSTTARTALSLGTGDNGTMVYDTTLNQFYMWNGSSWIAAFWPTVNGSALAITGTAGITGLATAAGLVGGTGSFLGLLTTTGISGSTAGFTGLATATGFSGSTAVFTGLATAAGFSGSTAVFTGLATAAGFSGSTAVFTGLATAAGLVGGTGTAGIWGVGTANITSGTVFNFSSTATSGTTTIVAGTHQAFNSSGTSNIYPGSITFANPNANAGAGYTGVVFLAGTTTNINEFDTVVIGQRVFS